MDRNDEVLRNAVTAAIDVIRDSDMEPALETSSSQRTVEALWPLIEGFKHQEEMLEFAVLFSEKFPDFHIQPFGGTAFDFIVGNVRNAVIQQLISRLEAELVNLEFCRTQMAFKEVPDRDWVVSITRIRDDISILRQLLD